jgi:hypothetical protein
MSSSGSIPSGGASRSSCDAGPAATAAGPAAGCSPAFVPGGAGGDGGGKVSVGSTLMPALLNVCPRVPLLAACDSFCVISAGFDDAISAVIW